MLRRCSLVESFGCADGESVCLVRSQHHTCIVGGNEVNEQTRSRLKYISAHWDSLTELGSYLALSRKVVYSSSSASRRLEHIADHSQP